jgi:AcrR family transcriptional regulator
MARTTRRRGKELEDALLDATWVVLERVGYAAVTFEAIAAEAATSKSVLYRRWPTLAELVLTAVIHRAPSSAAGAPDTGSLGGDLRIVLRRMSDRVTDLVTLAPGLLAELPGNPELLESARRSVFGSRTALVQAIADQAAARGEIPTAALPAHVLTAPLDLARHELLMSRRPLDQATIDALVDDIALPLYGA